MTTRLGNYRPGFFLRPNVTDWLTFICSALMAAASIGLAVALPTSPYVGIVPFIGVGILTLLWRRPTRAVFFLLFMATMVEVYSAQFSDATTERIPFWMARGGLRKLFLSPSEILIVLTLLIWWLRGLFSQTLQIKTSPLLRSYGLFLVVVLAAEIHGVSSGGDRHISFWELRPLVLGPLVLFLALNLLRSRQDLEWLGWLIILGTGLKGVQGSFRYLVTFHGHFDGNELLEHEEALLFPAFYLFVLLLFIFGGSRRQKRVGLFLLPWVMIADVANNRRASTGALAFSLIALILILFTIYEKHRLRILRVTLVCLVVVSGYLGAFWNSSSTLAKPARALKSQISPDPRDQSSDLYRQLENQDLLAQIRSHALIGQGFGIEMPLLPGMVDVRSIDPFMLIMPHNSVLWIWWRTGVIGFALFWMAYGLAITRNCFIARAYPDPYVRRWAIFAVLVTIMFVLIGYWDQALVSYRLVSYTWIILAVPEVLVRLSPHSPLALSNKEVSV